MFNKFLIFNFVFAVTSFANVTLCYVENITSPSKAESTKLQGGECAGVFSVQEMKANGWIIKDVIFSRGENGLNYTYSFSKQVTQKISDTQLDTQIKSELTPTISDMELKARIKNAQVELAQEKKENETQERLQKGKNIYVSKCLSCHGENGEKEPYTSAKLLGMSSNQFEASMRDYGLNEKDNGMALLMKPYLLLEMEYADVSAYLQSINVLEKSKEE